MPQPLDEKFREIDQWIVSGRSQEARHELRLLAKKPVPREKKAYFASLCRRAQLYSVALRILNPLVRPTGKKAVVPSAEEVCEYAAGLTYLGATEEASTLLSKISPKEVPQSQLFQAFALFAEWNYQDAILPLENYVTHPSLSDYQRLIGKVNLAAALTVEKQYGAARSLLEDLLIATEKLEMYLLNGNLWEISAQNEIFASQWNEASKCLKRAKNRLEKNKNAGYVFAEKWEIILKNLKTPSPFSRDELISFKKRAGDEELWEVVRDCERYEGIAYRDRALIEKVCFGTPYPAFRSSTEKLWGEALSLQDSYEWVLSEGESPVLLDLLSFSTQQRQKGLKPGLALHRLLISLVSDFYRPSRIAVLHHRLFPNEFYHPISSPKRVHEKIRFLRKWMKSCRLPLTVEQKKKYYFLSPKKPVTLKLFHSIAAHRSIDLRLVELKKLLPQEALTTKKVGRALQLSARSSVRLLSLGVEQGVLEPRGRGRAHAYFWKIVLLTCFSWGAFADPFKILGISPNSNPEEIKKAYLRKARELHPDVSPLPKAQAEKAFKELQSAWETIQQKKVSPSPTLRAKESARKQAEDFFQKTWQRGNWGADSFQGLSRWQKAQTLSSLSPLPARGPEEEGEWLAVSHFLRSHQAEILASKASELGQVLENIETYFALTAESVKDTRAGLLEPFEIAVLANSKSKEEFLESFQKRGERLLRAGSFSMGDSKRFFKENFFASVPLTDLEMAQDLLKTRLELIRQAPPTLHEAGFFLRVLPKLVSSEEQLLFLEQFKDQLDRLPREVKRQGSFRDLQSRIEQARARVMRKNPGLKTESPSFFRTFTEACSGVLKKLKK